MWLIDILQVDVNSQLKSFSHAVRLFVSKFIAEDGSVMLQNFYDSQLDLKGSIEIVPNVTFKTKKHEFGFFWRQEWKRRSYDIRTYIV